MIVVTEERPYERILDEMRPLPGVLTEIIRVLSDERSSARDVEKAMSCDQAITARILKIANSAFYGHSGKVKKLSQAIALIGYNSSLHIAIGAGLKDSLTSPLDARNPFSVNYWIHSLVTAVFSRSLGRQFGSELCDDMFLAGMMHDIGWGVLVKMQLDNPSIGSPENASGTIVDREQALYGTDHQILSAQLLTGWGFPSTVIALVRQHHTPEHSTCDLEKETRLLQLADHLAVENEFGHEGDGELEPLPESTRDSYVPDQEAADRILASLAEEFELVSDLIEAFTR